VLLAILVAGGAFIFMYLRGSVQGRKAAAETTRAITTASIAAHQPPRPTLELDERPGTPSSPEMAPVPSVTTRALDDSDDTPELPAPDAMTQAVGSAPAAYEDVIPAADLPPTEVVPTTPAADQPPTVESTPAPSHDQPTAAMPAAADDALPPTEAVSTSPAPPEQEPER